MKTPADGWDADEREAVDALEPVLDDLQARHAADPPVEWLRAARAGVLPDDLQRRVSQQLEDSAWNRALVAGFDDDSAGLTADDQSQLLRRIQQEASRDDQPLPRRRLWLWQPALAAAAGLPAQRSLRTPPVPLMTSPASGLTAKDSCSAANSSSDRYSSIRRVKSFVSTKVYTAALYGKAVVRQCRIQHISGSSRLTTKFSGGTPTLQHAGARAPGGTGRGSPAAEHFMSPRPLQRRVRRHRQRGRLFAP